MGLWDGYDNLGDRIWMDNWSNPDTNTAQGRIGRLEGSFNMRAENNASAIAQRAAAAGSDAVAATNEAATKASSTVQAIDAATARLSKNAALKALKSKPVKFNPPLHASIRPHDSPYRASYSTSDLSTEVFESPEARTAGTWRLGQLVGANEVTGAYKDKEDLDYRFGFRFLYNPTSLNSGASINSKTSPSALKSGSGLMLITGAGLGTISMEILLNRIPEVSAPRGAGSDLTEDEKELRDKGTMVDLDYLFRVANGTWDVTTGYGAPVVEVPVDDKKDKKKKKTAKEPTVLQSTFTTETGDIGMLLPTPMWLSIGPGLKYYGWLQEVTHKHTMFSPDMVPMLTRVSITFQRLNMGTEAEFKELDEAASQYAVMMGDVTAPPPDTQVNAPGGGGGEGQYPSDHRLKEWEKNIVQGPGNPDSVKNTIAAIRALAIEFPNSGINNAYRSSDGIDDHFHGLALDITPSSKKGTLIDSRSNSEALKAGDDICEFFIKNENRFGVCYMMWDSDLWADYDPNWDAGDGVVGPPPTDTHQDHIHMCFYPTADYSGRSGRPSYKSKIKVGTYWTEESAPSMGGSPNQTAPGGVDYDGWRAPANRMVNPGGYDFGAPRNYKGYPGLGHTGEDYSLGGGVRLFAMTRSRVVYIDPEYGRIVMRTNVPGGTLNICYLHCVNIQVSEGQTLDRGEHVGNEGGAGNYPVHLHLDFWWGSDTTPYGADLLDPNVVLRALFGKTPGDESPKANYSSTHLNFVRNRLGGGSTPPTRKSPTRRTGT